MSIELIDATKTVRGITHIKPTSLTLETGHFNVLLGQTGAGKTSLIQSVSQTPVVSTAVVTSGDESEVKDATTVAMDFGRISVFDELMIYLFGPPGQDRFAFMWDQIALGALGAVVLVDTRRLEESFAPIDYFEAKQIPFIVAITQFADAPVGTDDEIREALALAPAIPIRSVDARERARIASEIEALRSSDAESSGTALPPAQAKDTSPPASTDA